MGYVAWRPEQITARLSRLSIAAARKSDVVAALDAPPRELPALDIAAEQFELSDLKLGRLDLLAQNVGATGTSAWRVRRFDITNPDMKLAASGEWAPAASGKARRMKMNFKLDARDAGATLERLGFAGAMAAGHGALEGDIEWLGSPLDIDYATLSGKLAERRRRPVLESQHRQCRALAEFAVTAIVVAHVAVRLGVSFRKASLTPRYARTPPLHRASSRPTISRWPAPVRRC